jgi:hypothetical protein
VSDSDLTDDEQLAPPGGAMATPRSSHHLSAAAAGGYPPPLPPTPPSAPPDMGAGAAAKQIVDSLLARFLPLARRRIETAQAQVRLPPRLPPHLRFVFRSTHLVGLRFALHSSLRPQIASPHTTLRLLASLL